MIGGLVDGMLGGGTPHAGAASMYSGGTLSGTGKQYTSAVAVTDTYDAAIQKPMDLLAVSIGSALDGLAKQFSMPTGYAVGTGFKSDNDDPSAGRFIVTGPQGETLRQWEAYQRGELGARATGERYDKDPAKGFDQYLQSVTAATIPIVQGIVPKWADNLLNQLSENLGIAGALQAGKRIRGNRCPSAGRRLSMLCSRCWHRLLQLMLHLTRWVKPCQCSRESLMT